MQSIKNTTPFPFLLLLLALFFVFSNGSPTSGGKYELVESLGAKRLLADEPYVVNSSLVLAQERTTRKDPLDDFKKYRGGWNISEKHYWAVSILFSMLCFFFFFFFKLVYELSELNPEIICKDMLN
ncbi:putative transmembrane protein [Helianthus annuus]|nr:putative transmembrane protein [Helianthus annuus]